MTRNFRLVAFCLISFGFSLPAIGQDQALKKEIKTVNGFSFSTERTLMVGRRKFDFMNLAKTIKIRFGSRTV